MNFEDYQKEAKKTAIYPRKHKIFYPTIGLAGEAGEVANKVKKLMRDKGRLNATSKAEIALELGDCLWYIAAITSDLGYSLDRIAQLNLIKLKSREIRGRLKGSGDKR